MQKFITYILYSENLDGFYIGFTGDTLANRVRKHLSDHRGHTAKAKDWKIVYSEFFDTKSKAMQREKQLKSWKNKERIRQLIHKSSTE
jgi:putative endonuclease